MFSPFHWLTLISWSKKLFNLDMCCVVALAFENPQPGTPSQAPTVSKAEPIGVFWDIENCQVPHKKSAFQVVQKIRNCYFTGKSEVVFKCVCDTSKEKKAIIEELNKAQVRFSALPIFIFLTFSLLNTIID